MQLAQENAPVNLSDAASKRSLNKAELHQMLGQCLKLASENKITAQNTWSLPLLENLPELIKADDGDQTNFQRASVTLDAGVKIYSHRVDSVHTETYKMLGTFGRASGPQDEGAVEGEGGDEGEGAAGPKRRKRAVELNPDATLESSLAALNVKKFDLAFDVDPLFHKTSAQFDEGGAKGLLLNNLSVYRGCEIVFDSMDVPEQAVDCASGQQGPDEVDLSCLRGVLDGLGQLADEEGSQRRISPTLNDILSLLGCAPAEGAAEAAEKFVRDVSAAAGDVRPAPSASLMQTSTFSGGQAEPSLAAGATADTAAGAGASMGAGPEPSEALGAAESMFVGEAEEGRVAHAYGGAGGPVLADAGEYDGEYDDADDGGGFDLDGGFDDYSESDEQQSVMQQQCQPPAPFSTAKKGPRASLGNDALQWLISAGDGGAHSSSMVGKSWAGGSHWRYRAAAPQGSGAGHGEEVEGGGVAKKKRATRKKNDPLDFVALLQQPEQPEFTKLPRKAARKRRAPAKTLLPEDHHYKAERLLRYALRPRNTVLSSRRGGLESGVGLRTDDSDDMGFGGDPDFGGGGYSDDDGPGDSGMDGGWGGLDAAGGFIDGGEGSLLSGAATELLRVPRRVEKVEVNYSRAAKQVDVRALKETLWDGLHTVLPPGSQAEEVLSFQDVLATVPEHNPAGRLEDLSVHLCFICMLHLANEHGLVIRGVAELDQLEISHVPAA